MVIACDVGDELSSILLNAGDELINNADTPIMVIPRMSDLVFIEIWFWVKETFFLIRNWNA